MSDDQDGCEWVNISSGTGLPGSYLVTGLDWLTFSKAEDLDCSLKPSERL